MSNDKDELIPTKAEDQPNSSSPKQPDEAEETLSDVKKPEEDESNPTVELESVVIVKTTEISAVVVERLEEKDLEAGKDDSTEDTNPPAVVPPAPPAPPAPKGPIRAAASSLSSTFPNLINRFVHSFESALQVNLSK